MSSTLTYQLRQQQEDNKNDGNQVTNLPSPPNSSCGDETTTTVSHSVTTTSSTTTTTAENNNNNKISIPTAQQLQQRRDSLQSHFSTLTLQAISNSLPENYTIDHSSIKASLQQALNNTVTKLTTNNNNNNNNNHHHHPIKASSPIPIENNSPVRRNGSTTTHNGSYRSESPMLSQHLSPASIAAGTGGLTIRHRRPSTIDHRTKKGHLLPESPNTSNLLKSSTSLPSTVATIHHGGQYRCDDCGKVYKHPSCLTKHKWEHSEEWELTSKLLLTKHQQVQMLEAAAILVSMDNHHHGTPNSLPTSTESSLLNHSSYNNNNNHFRYHNNNNNNNNNNMNTDDDEEDDINVDIVNDGNDDDDESIHIDDDDDDISIEMDQDDDQSTMNTQHTTFPTMIGSTPAMLPSSFATNAV